MSDEKPDEKERRTQIQDAEEYMVWLAKRGKVQRKKFILKNFQCPGDILMLAACVRDIKIWYPDLEIDVRTSCNEMFDNNPYITKLDPDDPDVHEIDMEYPIIHESNQYMHHHFIHGFHLYFNEKTGYAVKLLHFKPDVHLTEDEKNTPVFDDLPEKFVVINAGGKTDYKTKWWWREAWDEVVSGCPEIPFVQVGKTSADDHKHEVLKSSNSIDKLGQTTLRELMRLIYQSSGTLSVVTSVMHIAAAFDKPATVVAGGHEPWWWEKYPNHSYFHTIGQLKCCKDGGCWGGECKNLDSDDRQKCLKQINPKDVAESIKGWFYEK